MAISHDTAVTADDIRAVLAAHPRLGIYGYGNASAIERAGIRQPYAIDLAVTVATWARSALVPAAGRGYASSYVLKHIAEIDLDTYVPNGVCIAALIACGYRMRPVDEEGYRWPNRRFAVTVRADRRAAA